MAAELKVPFDIADVAIISSQVTSDNKLLISVESQLETLKCGCCGREIGCNAGYGPELKLRHLPVLGMETYVLIRPRRAKCPHCWPEEKTTQVMPWYEERSSHTKAYEQYLGKQLLNNTVEDISLPENHRQNDHKHPAWADSYTLVPSLGPLHHRYVGRVPQRRRRIHRSSR